MTKNKELLNRLRNNLPFKAILSVTLENEQAIASFEVVVNTLREIELARRLTGRPAYLLFVAVKEQRRYDLFLDKLNHISGITKINSLITQRSSGSQAFVHYDGSLLKPLIHFKTD